MSGRLFAQKFFNLFTEQELKQIPFGLNKIIDYQKFLQTTTEKKFAEELENLFYSASEPGILPLCIPLIAYHLSKLHKNNEYNKLANTFLCEFLLRNEANCSPPIVNKTSSLFVDEYDTYETQDKSFIPLENSKDIFSHLGLVDLSTPSNVCEKSSKQTPLRTFTIEKPPPNILDHY